MKLSKCENGHFFDSDKYPECPYCNPALKSGGGIVQTQDAAAPEAVPSGPVAGWLVVTEGPGRGRDLRLGEGPQLSGHGRGRRALPAQRRRAAVRARRSRSL